MWLVKVGASNGDTPMTKKKSWSGEEGSGQPENRHGYATVSDDTISLLSIPFGAMPGE